MPTISNFTWPANRSQSQHFKCARTNPQKSGYSLELMSKVKEQFKHESGALMPPR